MARFSYKLNVTELAGSSAREIRQNYSDLITITAKGKTSGNTVSLAGVTITGLIEFYSGEVDARGNISSITKTDKTDVTLTITNTAANSGATKEFVFPGDVYTDDIPLDADTVPVLVVWLYYVHEAKKRSIPTGYIMRRGEKP